MFTDDISLARSEDEEIRDKIYQREVIISADCAGMDFQSVRFDGCRFIDCDLSKTSFYECKFKHCDLSNCKMPDSYWKDCEIEGCKCKGIDLTNSTFKQSAFKDNSFVYGLFSESTFEGSILSGCDLSNALFSQVTLRRTRFSGCRLTRAELFKTSLKGIDLSDCEISGIALSDTFYELRGAEVSYDQAAELAALLGIKIK